MFDPELKDVLLIRKRRPKWQAGYLNGLGGKVFKEQAGAAMAREFLEESGIKTLADDWNYFCTLQDAGIFTGRKWAVHCYWTTGPIFAAGWTSRERTEVHNIVALNHGTPLVSNCRWLIWLARDCASASNLQSPSVVQAYYPK